MSRARIFLLVLVVALLGLLHNVLWAPRSRTSSINVTELEATSGAPYTAVIIYLVALSRVSELLESLASLHKNLPGPPWPIVLYHTGDFDAADTRQGFVSELQAYIGAANGSWAFSERVEFVRLDWRWPEGTSSDVDVLQPVMPHVWPGYHQMCMYFSAPVFSEPRLKDVTYYMRMDTDSLITEPLCYDPFEVMHARQKSYGYRSITNDIDEVTIGLRTLVHDYTSAHPAVAERMRENKWQWPHLNEEGEMVTPRILGYNNNFEIVKLDAFRRPDVKAWLDDLTSVPERWLKYRWGDGPLRYVTTQMFFDQEKDLEQFCGMRYYHPYNPDVDCPCVPL